jgi:hypothetical protein
MRPIVRILFATTIMISPALALAQTAPGQGQYNGTSYWHTNGPASTGQPGVECDEVGEAPGHTEDARGSPFSEESVSGSHYAGEQPQNSRNSASVSQYDIACAGK